MQRIYIPWFVYCTQYSIVDKHILHQFIKVLKSRIEDQIIVFDGQTNTDYLYKIIKIEKKEIVLEFIDGIQKTAPQKNISLYQSLPNKYHKIEYILQKWVEVWVSNFYFFRSSRSQKLQISEHKKERFEQIVIEAMEQCGRNIMPEILFSEKWFGDFPSHGMSIILNPLDETSQTLKQLDVAEDADMNVFIWPEGWFSEEEIQSFQEHGCISIHLWNTILRTETAGIVTSFYLNQM